MKRLGLLVALVLVAVMAQAQVKFGAGAQAGISIGMFPDPADDIYGFGYGFGAHGDVIFTKNFAARLNFDYHMFASDKDAYKFTDQFGNPVTGVGLEGGTASIFGITANGIYKFPLGGSVTPYGLVGFGIHIAGVSDVEWTYQGQSGTVSTEGGSDFGINFGAGAEYAISKKVSLFGEVKYVLIFSSEETDPQTGQKSGGTTSHLPIMFGVTYWF
jgi:opacity protein-like surface antigen